jgi:hypothetical protein
MPCFTPEPTQEEIKLEQKSNNNKKYGINKTNSELITYLLNMCCEMGEVIFELHMQHRLSDDTLAWYQQHRNRDDKVKEIQTELSKLALKKESLERELKALNA